MERKGPALIEALDQSRSFGFLGPGPVERHVEHALALGSVAGEPHDLALDLGAGGGVPGLVLIEQWPESRWVLLDASERRTAFLAEAVRRLGAEGRVRVVRERAERCGRDPGHREAYELVVARSFGPPAGTAECAAALVRVGGRVVVSEPPESSAEDRWPSQPLRKLGLERRIVRVEQFSFALLDKIGHCPDEVPRREGLVGKRPLF